MPVTAMQFLPGHWEEESYPATEDLSAVILLATIFPVLRYILDRLVFEPVGRHFIFKKAREISTQSSKTADSTDGNTKGVRSIESIDSGALEKTHVKFKESCWKALFWTSSTLFALHACLGEPWLSNPKFFFMGPGDLVWPDQPMTLRLKAYMLFAGGFYVYSIFALVYWETRRKDFSISMVHHFCALGLITFAYAFRLSRIGCVVLLIHDACDIFLELAKISRYLNSEAMASVFFATFAGSWAALRLWCFPRFIVYSASYLTTRHIWFNYPGHPSTPQCFWDTIAPLVGMSRNLVGYFDSKAALGVPQYPSHSFLQPQHRVYTDASPFQQLQNSLSTMVFDRRGHAEFGPPLFYFFSTLLQLLLFLHIYWWILITRVLLRSLNHAGKVEGDVRSGSESEDEK